MARVVCVAWMAASAVALPIGAPSSAPARAWTPMIRQTHPCYKPVDQWAASFGAEGEDNFSKLDTLESCRADGGQFDLKIVYPLEDGAPSNTWRQTTNPVTATANGVDGYEDVDIQLTANVIGGWGTDQMWGGAFYGLEAGLQGLSLLDASVNHGHWFYAVGASEAWSGGIPGPGDSAVSQVEVWAICGGAGEPPAPPPPPPPPDGWALLIRQSAGFFQDNAAWTTDFGTEGDDNYSILSQMENWRGDANGKFHLKLVYPDMTDGRTEDNSNEWQQTTNFVTATTNGVDGYAPVALSYTLLGDVDAAGNDKGRWYGLKHNTDSLSVADGSTISPSGQSLRFYAIGSSVDWRGGIPGGTWRPETKVELYAKWPVVPVPPPPPPPPADGSWALLVSSLGN